MAYLDLVETIDRRANQDVTVRIAHYVRGGLTRFLNGHKEITVIQEGDMVTVSKADWEMYLLVKNSERASSYQYAARKRQNKKSHKFYSLFFLE